MTTPAQPPRIVVPLDDIESWERLVLKLAFDAKGRAEFAYFVNDPEEGRRQLYTMEELSRLASWLGELHGR